MSLKKNNQFIDDFVSDLEVYGKSKLSRGRVKQFLFFVKAFFDIDFRLVFYYRVYSNLVASGFEKLAILLYLRVKSRYSVDISPWAKVGEGLRIVHAFNIVIGPEVVIGKKCRIFNGVTLGNARPGKESQNHMPTIGSYCVLGVGAKLLGHLQIVDGTIVGANVVVVDGSTTYAKLQSGEPVRGISQVSKKYISSITDFE